VSSAAPKPESRQPSLLDGRTPSVEPGALARAERRALEPDAWVDYLPAWVSGHDRLMQRLFESTRWHEQKRRMYDRVVAVPRLIASLPADGPGHPLIEEIRLLLSRRYGTTFTDVALGYYRSGEDSVAWHGDYVARNAPTALVASVSLGEPRRFLLRPKGGGRSIAYALGWGDLLVMGGTCQRTWEHAIPKVARAGVRMAVVFRDFSPRIYR
jgi:alkylated DNA repair dioxygenase AlkB